MFLDRIMWVTEGLWAQDIAWKGTEIVNSSMERKVVHYGVIMWWNVIQYSCQKKKNRLNCAVNSKKFYFFKKFWTYLCIFRNRFIAPSYMRRLSATSDYPPKWRWQFNFLSTEGKKEKCIKFHTNVEWTGNNETVNCTYWTSINSAVNVAIKLKNLIFSLCLLQSQQKWIRFLVPSCHWRSLGSAVVRNFELYNCRNTFWQMNHISGRLGASHLHNNSSSVWPSQQEQSVQRKLDRMYTSRGTWC